MKLYSVLAAFVNKVAGASLYASDGTVLTLRVGDRIEPPATFSSPDAAQLERLTRAGCLTPKDGGGKSKQPPAHPNAPVSHTPAETGDAGDEPPPGGNTPEPGNGSPSASLDEGGGEAGADAVQAEPARGQAGGGRGNRAEPKPGGRGSRKKKAGEPA